MELTHASFFSGVGGTDIGLERAGWRTVSFSEIEPYACAVLREKWPGVRNLGDITTLEGDSIPDATLWSGGFPCTDLSVAGKRAGLNNADGSLTRSGLAITFLDLVERYRPGWILLENVPGLLSSNEGRDFGRLLRTLGELGYGWAYRILDARYFGVAQRRRRVFIVASLGSDRAREVLFESEGSGGNFTPRNKKRKETTGLAGEGADIANSITKRHYKGINTTLDDGGIAISPSPNPGGVRETDGLAGRSHHSEDLAEAKAFRKSGRAMSVETPETWVDDGIANTLNGFDVGDIRTTHAIVVDKDTEDDDLLPIGIDSHRYRVVGNGVVSNCAEWIGKRIIKVINEQV